MKSISLLLLILLTIISCSCAKQIEIIPNRNRPLPGGYVSSIKEVNGIKSYQLKLVNLVPPSELDSESNIYVIWASTQDNSEVKKVGETEPNFKGNKTITVETSLPDPWFFATAEIGPNVDHPSDTRAIKKFLMPPTQ